MKSWLLITLLTLVHGAAQPQSDIVTSEFEVASVKLLPHPELGQRGGIPGGLRVMRGGPGTGDPTRIHYAGVTLMALIAKAYGVYADQVFGPGWLTTEKYVIDAVLPVRSSEKQFNQMMQNLLLKRFNLIFQEDQRDLAVYNLVVSKDGAKLKQSTDSVDGSDDSAEEATRLPPTQVAVDKAGCPVRSPGSTGAIGRVGTNGCTSFRQYSISEFVRVLEMLVAMENGTYYGPQGSQAHIVDRTGLVGKFDFNLSFNLAVNGGGTPADTRIGGDISDPVRVSGIAAALEKQLGLKLEKTRVRMPVLIIQHVDRVPTSN